MVDERTVVITGGNGFVGRHLIDELKKEWPAVVLEVWDQNLEGLRDDVAAVQVDITEPDTYIGRLEVLQPTWVVHLAAIAPVPSAMKDPELTHRINTEATEHLLEAVSSKSSETQVLAVSSSEVYGKESSTPLPELSLDEANPRNPYAESKLEMERVIEGKYKDFVLRVRPFPHIGPGQARGFVTADFASQIAAIEKGKQEPVMQVGNLDTKRDFTDVRDVVRAYRLLMERGQVGEVYHVATGRAVSVKQILDALLALASVEIEVMQDPARVRPADISVLVGDISKLKEETGWQPVISLQQSLIDILDWWRNGSHNV